MEQRVRPSSFRSVIATWRFARLLLLGLLAGGCASTAGAPAGGAAFVGGPEHFAGASAYRTRYVAAAASESTVEPTVVERGAAEREGSGGGNAEKQDAAPTDVDPNVVEPAVVGYPPPRDPLMPFNRAMFAFNDAAYRYVLIPLGRGYVRITPEPVRESIGNFFSNLRTPISAVNHLFQGEPRPAGRSLLRFGINTTIGLLGLFDPASTIGFEPEKTTFDDTLARYGSGQGVYLVLPLIGPSDTRDAAGLVVDYFLNPVHYLADGNDERLLRASDTFQQFAPTGDEYETIRAKAEDPYIFFRNLYWQGVRRDLEY